MICEHCGKEIGPNDDAMEYGGVILCRDCSNYEEKLFFGAILFVLTGLLACVIVIVIAYSFIP